MLRFQSLLIAKLVLVLTCSTGFAQGVKNGLPSRRDLARFNLEQQWWNQATIDYRRDKVRYLTADEESLYVQSTAGAVTCIDTETGKRRWSLQLGLRDSSSFPVTTNDDYALVVAGMTLYAVDKMKGELVWQLKLPKVPSTSPTSDQERIYIGTLDGSVYAFSLKTIREHYEANKLPQWSQETVAWRYQTADAILVPPMSTGRVVAFASRDKSLYSVVADNRDLNWQFETDAPISAPLAHGNGTIYLASEDLNCYRINADNGQVLWEFIAGQPIRKAPIVIDEHLFLAPQRGGLFCLRTTNGERQWWQPRLTEFLAATDSYLFTSDRSGNVVVQSRDPEDDGAILGALPLRHFSKRISNDRTDRLYLATEQGLVVAIRERGSEFPTYHKYPERRPLLPELYNPETASEEPPADTN